MRKICAITANRADFSRIESILSAIKNRRDLKLQLIVLGSHLLEKTGRTVEEIKRKGFAADHSIYMELDGSNPVTMTKSVGLAVVELATALDHLKPDIVIVPVDRFESLAMASAAATMNSYIAHIQGGEVTGTIDESIRHAITKLSHLHFVSTAESRERVIKMGERQDFVFDVGCPATDLLLKAPVLNRGKTLSRLNMEVIKGTAKLDNKKPYFLMVQHPVTTEFGKSAAQIVETLEALKKFKEQVVVLWPNIDAGSDEISKALRKYSDNWPGSSKLIVLKHMPTELFANVLRNASVLVGNSSSGIREACYFGTPVVNIGTRQSGRERGSNVLDAGNDREEIFRAVSRQNKHGKYPLEKVYGKGDAGVKVAEILAKVELPSLQKKITY